MVIHVNFSGVDALRKQNFRNTYYENIIDDFADSAVSVIAHKVLRALVFYIKYGTICLMNPTHWRLRWKETNFSADAFCKVISEALSRYKKKGVGQSDYKFKCENGSTMNISIRLDDKADEETFDSIDDFVDAVLQGKSLRRKPIQW